MYYAHHNCYVTSILSYLFIYFHIFAGVLCTMINKFHKFGINVILLLNTMCVCASLSVCVSASASLSLSVCVHTVCGVPILQSQICESAKQIIELSFAPLAKPESPGLSETSRSETTLPTSGLGLKGGSKDDCPSRGRPRSERDSWRRANVKDGFRKANSVPSLHSSPR